METISLTINLNDLKELKEGNNQITLNINIPNSSKIEKFNHQNSNSRVQNRRRFSKDGERRNKWRKERFGNNFPIEKKLECLKEKKNRIEKMLNNEQIDQNKKEKLQKRLQFISEKIELMTKNEKQKSSFENVQNGCSKNEENVCSRYSNFGEERRKRKLEKLIFKKEKIESQLKETNISPCSSDSSNSDSSNSLENCKNKARTEKLFSRLNSINNKIKHLEN